MVVISFRTLMKTVSLCGQQRKTVIVVQTFMGK